MSTHSLPKNLFPFICHFLKKHWPTVLLIQLLQCAWAIDHTCWPYVVMRLVDTINAYTGRPEDIWSALSVPIIMGFSLWFFIEPCYRLSGWLSARFFPNMEADVRMSLYDYVMQHSPQYFTTHLPGATANKIADMPQSLTRLLQKIIVIFVPVSIALLISLVFFAAINFVFALILASWICVHLFLCCIFAFRCDSDSREHAEARSVLAGKIADGITNNGNVRLFARHAYEHAYLMNYQNQERAMNRKALLSIEKMKFALGIASFFGTFIGLNWYMIYSWQQGNLSAGQVVFVFNTTWNIAMMAWAAATELPGFYREIGVAKQALTLVQTPHEIVDIPNAPLLQVSSGKIVFDHVTFAYKKEKNLFTDKTITIAAGEKVGLVGFSGSGKSTFVNLILRYYDVQGGRILIDGQDIAKVTQASLREQISVIPQDPILFHRNLLENIRYGRLDATDEEVVMAARKARCDEFIQKMPDKYASLVGERGTRLSGGQRQGIAIARVFLKQNKIFILDEATSALDAMTEREVHTVLEEAMEGHTTIVIAHRLSTLSGMDRILVFKEGRVIEEGTHESLLEAEGHYAMMWRMQVGGFLPEWSEGEGEEEEES